MNCTATTTRIGIVTSTISARRQLMYSMKAMALVMLKIAQTTSSMPQVTSCATFSESEVTRDMIQPTGVRPK